MWITMRFSVGILKLLRESGVTLVTRISGLLLSAIAVQLVADAVRAFIEGSG
jgi:multiple antibiotic resistance protein